MAAAAERARTFWISRRAFLDSVLSVDQHGETYQRAHHVIERRYAELATTPAHGARASEVQPLPTAPPDPWTVDPDQIERETAVVATCPQCDGHKHTACVRCGGGARVPCQQCGASGRVYGQRGPKKCPKCRGRGDVKCLVCRAGKVPCATCGQTGRVHACVRIVRQRLDRVVVHPAGSAASAHPHVQDPRDFDTPVESFVSELTSDERLAPEHVPTALWPADFEPRADRARSVRVQTFCSPLYRIEYGTALGRGCVEVAGRNAWVSPSSDWRPLRRRRTLVATVGATATLGALVLPCIYASRHAWYAMHGHPGRVLLLAFATAACAAIATLGVTLHRRARALLRSWVPLGLMAGMCIGSAIAFAADRPSLAAAQRFFDAGAIERAEFEASALDALGMEREGARQVLDRVHLHRVEHAPSIEEMDRVARSPWFDAAFEAQARQALRTTILAAIPVRATVNDLEGLRRLRAYAELIGPAAARDLEQRVVVGEAEACLAAADFACVESKLEPANRLGVDEAKLASLRRRAADGLRTQIDQLEHAAAPPTAQLEVQQLEREAALARQYERLSGGSASVTVSQLEHRLAQARHRVEAEARRAEAERVRAERQAAREAARREEEERRRDRRWAPLRCCDGTLSPSCTCGGSRRGCCSHHGGVCGCGG